ncbi:MAG: hypothetical protein M3R35_08975 [Candidatus Eremiobacteraeota bacterium]|nr:hypothetical protein [Candidatus Eremiobacteraeota bacterium]
MPFLSLVHLRDMQCAVCKSPIARAGARSFVVDLGGTPIHFSTDDPPAEMIVELVCSNGHANELNVPNEISAEETLSTPDDAPIACDATLTSGTTEGGVELAPEVPGI